MTNPDGDGVEPILRAWRTNDAGDDIELFYSREPITRIFNASGVDTKPLGTIRCTVELLGAGAGGRLPFGVGLGGGHGGGGGGIVNLEYEGQTFDNLPDTISVAVPAGGVGGTVRSIYLAHGGNGGIPTFNGDDGGLTPALAYRIFETPFLLRTPAGGGPDGGDQFGEDGGIDSGGAGGFTTESFVASIEMTGGSGDVGNGGTGGITGTTRDGTNNLDNGGGGGGSAAPGGDGGNGGNSVSGGFAESGDDGVLGGGGGGGGDSNTAVGQGRGGDGGNGRVVVKWWYY